MENDSVEQLGKPKMATLIYLQNSHLIAHTISEIWF